MNNHVRKFNKKMCKNKITFLSLVVMLLATTTYGIIPKGAETGMMQFDAIVEFNAQCFQTHVLLFVRYWVSPGSYTVSVVWAEPHVGSLNFSTYPITMVIESDEQNFRIANDVLTKNNSVFYKPLEDRGVFRYMFNDYPIPNIRFAEPEALASRIYTNDIGKVLGQTKDGWQTIDIRNSVTENGIDREVMKLDLRVTDGRIDALKLLDAKEKLIKSIEYEYSDQEGGPLLLKQNVILAERPFTIGRKGKGINIKIDNEERTYRDMGTMHHKGTRKCSVDYESTKIDDKLMALPTRVAVRRADEQKVLRSSRLFNFKRVELNSDQVRESAEAFSSFDGQDWKCREMLLKYWTKDPSEVEEEDLKALKQLQSHFEKISTIDKTTGDQLRRVNMLLQIDWILGDSEQLKKHFQQYLDILSANDLDRMVLVGGQYAIDTTIRWRHFAAADDLLEKWVDKATAVNDEEAILDFGESVIMKNRFWTVARLLEKSLSSPEKWGQKLFNAETLRCMALYKIYEMLRNPDKVRKGLRMAQANWVSSSTSIDKLFVTLNESIADAQKTFANLDEPTREQKVLREQLEKIQPPRIH